MYRAVTPPVRFGVRSRARFGGPFFLQGARLRVRAYIGGFNLYYGSLKDKPDVKWLDLFALSAALMPNTAISCVSYFTARIRARPEDPQEATRQQMYLRALAGDARIRIIEGQYVFRRKAVRLWDR